MLHYVQNRYQVVDDRRVAMGAVCGDRDASAATLTLSDVQSLIDCPKCRDEICKLEASDPEKLAMIENAWKGTDAEKPVWNAGRQRWVLPSWMPTG